MSKNANKHKNQNKKNITYTKPKHSKITNTNPAVNIQNTTTGKEENINIKDKPVIKKQTPIKKKQLKVNNTETDYLKPVIVAKLVHTARLWKEQLAGREFLVVGRQNPNAPLKTFIITFTSGNFMHLTGIKAYDKDGNQLKANEFFFNCVNGNISNFEIETSNKAEAKLMHLTEMIELVEKIKRLGLKNKEARTSINFNILIKGTTGVSVAFINDNTGRYVPCSLIHEKNMKRLTSQRIIVECIYSKKNKQKEYAKLLYLKKGSHVSARKIERVNKDIKIARGGLYRISSGNKIVEDTVQDTKNEQMFEKYVRPTLPHHPTKKG